MSYLKVIAIGNLGRDVDLRYTPDGKPIATFSMATSEKKKDRATGEWLETTTWLRVTFFNRQAEVASQYLTKGKPVYIEGRGRLETWTDRDGKERTTLEVFGTEMQFIGSREDNGQQSSGRGAPSRQSNNPRAAARERAKTSAPAGGGLSLGNEGSEPFDSDKDVPF